MKFKKLLDVIKTTKFWVIVCAAGIWSQFIYNIATSEKGAQNVYVTGGEVDVPNGVEVNGSVEVDNMVDINVSAINGYSNCFYNSYSKHPREYFRIPVNTN